MIYREQNFFIKAWVSRCSKTSTLTLYHGIEDLIHCDLDAFYASVETLHHNLDPEVPLIWAQTPKVVREGELYQHAIMQQENLG